MTTIKPGDIVGVACNLDNMTVMTKVLTPEEAAASNAWDKKAEAVARVLCVCFGEGHDVDESGQCAFGGCDSTAAGCRSWFDFSNEAEAIMDAIGEPKPIPDYSNVPAIPAGQCGAVNQESTVTANFGSWIAPPGFKEW